MTLRSALQLAAAALAAAAAPVLAQDPPYDPGPPPPLPLWEDEWEENPDDKDVENEPVDDEDGHVASPDPAMEVEVPVVAEQPDCECETVVEERVDEEPAPPRARHVATRRDKRIRITK